MIAFGPVPSRRLGRSLGVNNIPPKACTYSCVYCQLGRTKNRVIKPSEFYDPARIVQEVEELAAKAGRAGEPIDYLTFVADGEPSLDIHLGEAMEQMRLSGLKIAVITNSSLIWDKRIRQNLQKADWVSLKIDSVDEETWRKINRPHHSLELRKILDHIVAFAREYRGKLVTETMLVRGLNDSEDHMKKTADFIGGVQPATSYLSVPVRPPAEDWVGPPAEEDLIRAYQLLSARVQNTEYLIGYEGNAFAFTGDLEKDLLSITAVHPMREEAVNDFLSRAEADWSVVEGLIARGALVKREFQGRTFYARKLCPLRSHGMLGLRME
jgi:wyosine [tRNA(Phe)-imidazoG37] synthetase (radical SAM superfamily)